MVTSERRGVRRVAADGSGAAAEGMFARPETTHRLRVRTISWSSRSRVRVCYGGTTVCELHEIVRDIGAGAPAGAGATGIMGDN